MKHNCLFLRDRWTTSVMSHDHALTSHTWCSIPESETGAVNSPRCQQQETTSQTWPLTLIWPCMRAHAEKRNCTAQNDKRHNISSAPTDEYTNWEVGGIRWSDAEANQKTTECDYVRYRSVWSGAQDLGRSGTAITPRTKIKTAVYECMRDRGVGWERERCWATGKWRWTHVVMWVFLCHSGVSKQCQPLTASHG